MAHSKKSIGVPGSDNETRREGNENATPAPTPIIGCTRRRGVARGAAPDANASIIEPSGTRDNSNVGVTLNHGIPVVERKGLNFLGDEQMDEQTELAKRQIELMERQNKITEDLARVIGANHNVETGECDFEKFKLMKPPSFNGATDPSVAEAWIKKLEKIFRFIQDQKMEEFAGLVQGGMTVAQYEAKFTELSHFAPHIIVNDYYKAKKFLKGLRQEIRSKISTTLPKTYAEVVEKAHVAEEECEEDSKEQIKRKKHEGEFRGGLACGPPKRQGLQRASQRTVHQRQGFQRWGSPMQMQGGGVQRHEGLCHFYRKNHRGHPCRASNSCFVCGKEGHFARDCPTRGMNTSQPSV